MKRAELLVSGELLHEVLCLPEGLTILGVVHDPRFNQWSFVVAGDSLPDGCESKEGQRPPLLQPQYLKDNDAELASGVTWKV